MNHPKVRRLLDTDYHEYHKLINCFRETSYTETQFKKFLNDLPANIHIWVLEDSSTGKLLATGTIIYEDKLIFNICKLAHIEDICVTTELRTQGLGSMMLMHLEEQARYHNCYKVTLVCNEVTSSFYTKNGFEIRGVQCSKLL